MAMAAPRSGSSRRRGTFSGSRPTVRNGPPDLLSGRARGVSPPRIWLGGLTPPARPINSPITKGATVPSGRGVSKGFLVRALVSLFLLGLLIWLARQDRVFAGFQSLALGAILLAVGLQVLAIVLN